MGVFWKMILSLLVLCLCPVFSAAEKPLQKIVLMISWQQQAQFAGFYMAQEQGFYRELGLNVEIRKRKPNLDLIDVLENRDADIIVATLPEGIEMHNRNPKVINIGQMFQQSSAVIVTRAEDKIGSIAELNGKRLTAWPGNAYLITDLFLKTNKLKMDMVFTDRVDEIFLWGIAPAAVMMYYHEYFSLLMSGCKRDELNVFHLKDLGLNLPEDGIYCLLDTYNKDRSLWYKFNLATVRGWQLAFREDARTLAVIRTYCERDGKPFSAPLQRWMLRHLDDIVLAPTLDRTPGILDKDSFDDTASVMMQSGLISKMPDYRAFYWGPLSPKKFRTEAK